MWVKLRAVTGVDVYNTALVRSQLILTSVDLLPSHELNCRVHRVIQRAIEMSDEHGRNTILQQLEGREAQLLQDSKGNHVIQKCIQTVRAAADHC